MADFHIQLGHPTVKTPLEREYDRLADVFPVLFPENAESCYLFWHKMPIRLHYAFDLHKSFNDILAMCWLLVSRPEGASVVHLETETHFADWNLSWKEGQLRIEAEFSGRTERWDIYGEALNGQPVLEIPVKAFLAEWKGLLQQVQLSLKAAKITIPQEGTEWMKPGLLQRVVERIPKVGVLYQKEVAE